MPGFLDVNTRRWWRVSRVVGVGTVELSVSDHHSPGLQDRLLVLPGRITTIPQIGSLTNGPLTDLAWTSRERRLIRCVDELAMTNDLSDDTWKELADEFTDAQLLDLVLLCGWYRAISGLCRALRVDLEDDVPRFIDFERRKDRATPAPARVRVPVDT